MRLALASGRLLLAWYVAIAVIAGSAPVAAAWLTKLIIDVLTAPEAAPIATILLLALMLGVTGIVIELASPVRQYLERELDRRIAVNTQANLYRAVNRFPGLARFENPRQLDRIQLAQQGSHTAPGQIVRSSTGAVQAILTLGGFFASLAVLSVPLTLFLIAAGVPTLAAQLKLSRRRAQMFATITPFGRRRLFYSRLLTEVSAAKEIRLFGLGEWLRQKMLDEQLKTNHEQRRTDRYEVRVQTALVLLATGIAATALIWAVINARSGEITVGDVAIVIAAVAGIQGSLRSIVHTIADGHEALLLFDSYTAVIADTGDLPRRECPVDVPKLRRCIEFDDVWFRYADDHQWVLRGVSTTIAAGKSWGLVGTNGSGKSTLVKLLCRFYDPQHGAIRWDGVDLRDMDPDEYRRSLGVLFQDFMHYDLSVYENVSLAAPRTDEEVREATRLAGIHDTIARLPLGYATMLSRIFSIGTEEDGKTGVILSGGQWQRLALARTLLKRDSDVVILDEPSSGLDAQAEYEIHTRLREHRASRTSILISHRLSTVRDSDMIVVLSAGRVSEAGNHTQLMAADGEYAALFETQARGYQSPTTASLPLSRNATTPRTRSTDTAP
jgi:ATP-binding cassette, subfamily B, bacterial